VLPDRYDDSAYSGATTERPALQRLMADVRAGRLDAILVYKIDRLSRSLLDFTKLVSGWTMTRQDFQPDEMRERSNQNSRSRFFRAGRSCRLL
jgi:site-specific DNA recombinase